MDPRTEQMLAERRQNAVPLPPPPVGREAAVGWLKERWLPATLAGTAVLVALSVSYYLLIALPSLKREQAAAAAQAKQQVEVEVATRATALEACLTQTQADYTTLWEAACKERGAAAGCPLPTAVIKEQDRRRTEARNDCLRRYSLTQ